MNARALSSVGSSSGLRGTVSTDRLVRRLSTVMGLWALVACASAPQHPRAPTLDDLRRASAAAPKDAKLARELALAESFANGGDPARALPALERATALADSDPALAYVRALMLDSHGKPAAALAAYLRAIELAARAGDGTAQFVIEAASYGVAGQNGMSRGYADKVRAALTPLLESETLSAAARGALADVLLPLAYRRGDQAEIARIGGLLGCARSFRVAGPFGPRELLGFDAAAPADPARALPDSMDLGPGRGVRPTRTVTPRGCSVHLGGGPIAEGGLSVAETTLSVPRAGKYVVRLDSPNSTDLFVDGRSALRIDRRRALGSRVVFQSLELAAGEHRLTFVIATRHPNPVLELSLAPERPSDGAELGTAPLSAGFALYLRTAVTLARGDLLAARQALAFVDDAKDASPLFLLQRSAIALNDPLVPDEVRDDDARRYLGRAVQRDPELWAPVVQLAGLAAQAGRVDEAIGALRKAKSRWPELPAIGNALGELLQGKGFTAAAEREVAELRALVPDACGPMAAELEANRARQRYAEVATLAEQLVRCDAESSARYSFELERRDFGQAKRELARLTALQNGTGRYASLLAELSLAKSVGDEGARWSAIRELRTRYPRSYAGAIEEFDALLSAGKREEARAALDAALSTEPASMSGLHRVSRALLGDHVLGAYRRDGLAAIKAFESSGKAYDGPQLLLLDYMAVRVFADGSSLELVHTVQRAQSDEAVNELGEVQVPEGAEVLHLRSIKPDGRTLEADNISGKDTVSIPSLARGDYVEFEYLRANAPADGFPGGYLGERFYFKSFEVPFHHSQMIVLLPKAMPYELDPRGAAPTPTVTESGELRVLDFSVDESVPLSEEPNSVASREFIPSMRVGVKATFPAMVESLRDLMIDRDLYDPYYAALALEIVGDGDVRQRAERLYAWVLANIENSSDVFSQAALMLRARRGNRARVLHYLYQLAGVPSQLALARSYAGDATESAMADGDTYDQLLVKIVQPGQAPIWLFTVERWAPFGFMPPLLQKQPALTLAEGAPSDRVSEGLLGADSRRFAVKVALRKEGSARVDVVETLRGSEAVGWRAQLEQIPAAELERRIEQDYVARLFPGASLVSLEIVGREQQQPELSLHYVAEVSGLGRPTGNGLSLAPVLPSELAANFARSAARKTTELIPSPVRTIVELTVALPAGFAPPASTPAVSLVGKLPNEPSFAETIAVTGDTFTLKRTLNLPRMRVEPAQYATFADFCRKVDAVEDREIVLQARP